MWSVIAVSAPCFASQRRIILISSRKHTLGKRLLGRLTTALAELLELNPADDALLDIEKFL